MQDELKNDHQGALPVMPSDRPTDTAVEEPPMDQADQAPSDPAEQFAWHASEYVHHHKGPMWYLGLAGIILVLLVVAAVFKLWLSIGVFLAMGVAIAVYAQKPPRVLEYELTSDGINIDGRYHPYTQFRSFGVVTDEDWHVIDLEPTQRFMPRLSILFDDQTYDAIVEHLARHLPRSDRQPDLIERASRYLRF